MVQLLRKLVAKFEKRPSRGLLLTRWLAAVLRFHTSFLISVPDLSTQLAGLSQMLEQRLASYTRLAALGGRLDLLLSQIHDVVDDDLDHDDSHKDNHNSAVKRRSGGSQLDAFEPRQVYVEDD